MASKDCCEIILDHKCDLACRFCSQGDFDPKIKSGTGEAVRHIYAAGKLGFKRLGFSGGEALLRKDLPALAAAARKVGFKAVRLQTNGMKLSDPGLCAVLARSGLTVCKFTFLGDNARTHDGLTGTRGSFKKSLAGLDNMLALKLSVGVNILITRQNHRSLRRTLRFFMDRGVSKFVLIYPIYAGRMRDNFRTLGISMPAASPSMVKALDLAAAAGLSGGIKALNMPPCLLPGHEDKAVDLYKFNTVVVSPGGAKRDLDDTVAGAKVRGAPCARCIFRKRCFGVDSGYLELFGWKGFRPVLKRVPAKQLRPEPGYLNGLERCFVEVLKKEDRISTARVLELAAGLALCQDCKDGSSVLVTGEALIKKGLVKRDFVKGGYFWRLK